MSAAVTPLVLVHGGMNSALAWAPVAAVPRSSRDRGRPAGSWKESAGDLATVTLDDAVATVLEEADAQGFDRFVLVGHSLGGVTITETRSGIRNASLRWCTSARSSPVRSNARPH